MTQEFNPNSPKAIGLEWRPTDLTERHPAPTSAAVVQRWLSTAAETIDEIDLFAVNPEASTAGRYVAEMVGAGNEAPVDVVTTTLTPNVATLSGGATTSGPSALTVVQQTPGSGNGVIFLNADDEYVDVEFPTDVATFAGRRILGVTIRVAGWGGNQFGDIAPRAVSARVGGSSYDWLETTGKWTTGDNNNQQVVDVGGGEIHPESGQPFTEAELDAFDTTATAVRLQIRAPATAENDSWRILGVRMIVRHCVENRVARGAFEAADYGEGPINARWETHPLLAPDGSGWAKADATAYALIVRQAKDIDGSSPNGTLDFWFPFGAPSPFSGQSILQPTQNANGEITAVATAASGSALASGVFPMMLTQTSTSRSVDAFPYAVMGASRVHTSSSIEQNFDAPASADFGPVLCLVGWGDTPDDDLTVEVRRTSDSAVMGTVDVSTVDIAATGVAVTPGAILALLEVTTAYLALIQTSDATLVSGTEYEIRFSSGAASATAWSIGAVSTLSPTAQGGDPEATFGGSAWRLTQNGLPVAGDESSDLAGFLTQIPDTPEALTATADTEAVSTVPAGVGDACLVGTVPVIDLAWTQSAEGADFARYEIERYDAVTGAWALVAEIADESVEAWVDYEPRIGVESCYRIRTVVASGAVSAWEGAADSGNSCATPTGDCAYSFTTNADPAAVFAYPDIYDRSPVERGYEFPEADLVEYRRIYGRDYPVAFHPTERSGIGFSRTLLVDYLLTPTPIEGPDAFAAFRDFVWRTDVPYVCVRDANGARFFAQVAVPSGAVRQPSSLHWIECRVREIADGPTSVEVEAAS